MASTSELSLDWNKPHIYSMLLKSFGDQAQADHQQTQKLEEFLACLEEERLKIDAFKRELPLCMQLLTNAVETSRQQLQGYKANQNPRPFLEEFIPLKHSPSDQGSEKPSNTCDKASWMTSAQLWTQASDIGPNPTFPKESDIVSPKLVLDNKQRNGRAFLPFSKERNLCHSQILRALPKLAINSAEKEREDRKCSETETGICGNDGAGNLSEGQETGTNTSGSTAQNLRKARRCWSPDLHRRFVNALQILGGSQVATPKQIRELMKVDGLTNDEVKSHLQKYRLHTRRPSPIPQAGGGPTPQLVVLGGIWVPPEYATGAGGPTLYGTHPVSQHFCAPPLSQEFYTPQPVAPHHQLHHHQLQVSKAASPESDDGGGRDRSESIEDGKSESSSWKGEGGENGDVRKGLGTLRLREDGAESNGSEITLKF